MISILLVEDERIVAKDIERSVSGLGYEVAAIVQTGAAAFEKAREIRPDLILMDIKLKGKIDGIEAAAMIKDYCDVPIVYLTAFADDTTLERAKITEPFGYILKPFNDRELHTTIEMAVYRHRTEKLLRQSEKKYHTLFENSKDSIFITDKAGAVTEYNRSFLDTFLYNDTEMTGVRIVDLCHDTADADKIIDELNLKGSVKEFPMKLKRKDGKVLECLVNAVELKDADGLRSGYQGSVRDVTEERLLEAQLRHTQKIEAIGTLASGISHDFNNILTTISGYAGLLKLKISDPMLSIYADNISSACEKATNVTKGLLVFSRKQTVARMPVDINGIIRKFETFLGRLLRDDIVLDIGFDEEKLVVLANQDQIEQVIMNLATNARDAMPDGGTIRIRTGRCTLDAQSDVYAEFGHSGNFVLLTVSDTGIGIDTSIREKIFDPFFTTKEAGKGTGLGLSIIYRIIKQHGGFITLKSEPGRGTSFEVYFPLTEPIDREASIARTASPRAGSEKILLAEDESLVCDFVETGLKSHGYTVITARDGDEALEKFRQYDGGFSLVILDVVMPKANGQAVLDKMKGINPDIGALFMSGHDRDSLVKEYLIDDQAGYIQKPFTVEKLLAEVRALLDRSARPGGGWHATGKTSGENNLGGKRT